MVQTTEPQSAEPVLAQGLEPDLSTVQGDPSLFNEDLAPVEAGRRTWSTRHFIALWVGMCVSIPAYMMASTLISGGMSMSQALWTVFLGNVIVLIPMILNGHVGVKYGIPFPVYSRASFGVKGANIPALLRAVVACGWFGIQAWIGGTAIYTILNIWWPGIATLPNFFPIEAGLTTGTLLCFFIFWGINVGLIFKGIESIKILETYAAPILVLAGLGLLYWAFQEAGGKGDILSVPSKFESNAAFMKFFIPSLTGVVGYWATLSLNIPDFTRYATSQKAQIVGQSVGLPATMTLIAFIGIAVTSASVLIYGMAIWDPITLVGKFTDPVLVTLSMLIICLATLAMNVAANVVAPANDFANVMPQRLNFKTGGLLTALIGIAIMPWKLVADPSGYIFTWLVGYSALLGPVAGILLTDYYLIRRTELDLEGLYRTEGPYTFTKGYNMYALIALIAGIFLNIPGFLVQINAVESSVFPEFFTQFYTYAWFIGIVVASLVYYGLMVNTAPAKTPVPESIPTDNPVSKSNSEEAPHDPT